MRNTKELLSLLKDGVISRNFNDNFGMCDQARSMYLWDVFTYEEFERLLIYIHKNKPSEDNQYKHFTNREEWINNAYWFVPILDDDAESGIKVRVDYINELIKNYKNED